MPFLLEIVIALILVGLLLWIVEQLPLDAAIVKIIRVVVIVFVVIWVLYLLVPLFPTSFPGPAPFRR